MFEWLEERQPLTVWRIMECIWMTVCAIILAFALLLSIGLGLVQASWYSEQTLTQATMKRLGVSWISCCEWGDVFRTKFKVVQDGSKYGTDRYFYWQDGKWKPIPPDIVHHEPTPNHEPVLFLFPHNRNPHIPLGTPICFKIDSPGI